MSSKNSIELSFRKWKKYNLFSRMNVLTYNKKFDVYLVWMFDVCSTKFEQYLIVMNNFVFKNNQKKKSDSGNKNFFLFLKNIVKLGINVIWRI